MRPSSPAPPRPLPLQTSCHPRCPPARPPSDSPRPRSRRCSTPLTPTTPIPALTSGGSPPTGPTPRTRPIYSERECKNVERVAPLPRHRQDPRQALFDIIHDDDHTLTAAQRRAIATHPARVPKVLSPLLAFYADLPEGVLAHHERLDGTGYPRGLKGRRIPLSSRIVAIACTHLRCDHESPALPRCSVDRDRSQDHSGWARHPVRSGPRGPLSLPTGLREDSGCHATRDTLATSRRAATAEEGRSERPRHHLPLASRTERRARAARVGSGAPNSELITAIPPRADGRPSGTVSAEIPPSPLPPPRSEPRARRIVSRSSRRPHPACCRSRTPDRYRHSRRQPNAPPRRPSHRRADDESGRNDPAQQRGRQVVHTHAHPVRVGAIFRPHGSLTMSGTSGIMTRTTRVDFHQRAGALLPQPQRTAFTDSSRRGAQRRSAWNDPPANP